MCQIPQSPVLKTTRSAKRAAPRIAVQSCRRFSLSPKSHKHNLLQINNLREDALGVLSESATITWTIMLKKLQCESQSLRQPRP